MKELKTKTEDMWDVICSDIGFDRKGRELQKMIKKFVELKMLELSAEKGFVFIPHREGIGNYSEKFEKPMKYELKKGEVLDVFYWVKWPSYDFIFGKPAKDNPYKKQEAAFFQYRNRKKKKVICGFYLDKNELQEIKKGFNKL